MLESWRGWVNMCELLQICAFEGLVQKPAELCVLDGCRLNFAWDRRGMRNSLCRLLKVNSMHVKVTWAEKSAGFHTEHVVQRWSAAMPAEMPYWAKNYVTIYMRPTHWMPYFIFANQNHIKATESIWILTTTVTTVWYFNHSQTVMP